MRASFYARQPPQSAPALTCAVLGPGAGFALRVWGSFKMGRLMNSQSKLELGMKVAVRRGVLEHIGVVIRLEGEHVVVCWTQSEWPEGLSFASTVMT